MSHARRLCLALAVLLALAAAPAHADTLQLQGALRSASGGPVADGVYGLAVALYGDAQGTQKVFKELFIAVQVQGGLFALTLGAGETPLDGPAVGAAANFVGVQVGFDPELPLVALSAVPRAWRAAEADHATAADTAKLADKATLANKALAADQANTAESAKTADSAVFAESANTAKLAEVAKKADAATSADEAMTALGLQCSGCVTAAMMAPDALAPFAKTAELHAVAVSGKYDDLVGKPTDVGLIAGDNTWTGKNTFAGIDVGKGEARFLRLHNSAEPPVPCEPAVIGLIYFNTGDKGMYVCNGKDWFSFATTLPLGGEDNAAQTCKAILDANPQAANGAYWLDPDGKGGPEAKFQAWCDMTQKGGGWTLILSARRLSRANFARHGVDTYDPNIGTVNPTYKSTYHLFRKVPFATGLRLVCFGNENVRDTLAGATVDIEFGAATAAKFKAQYLAANAAYNIGDNTDWKDTSGTKRFGSNGDDDFYAGGPITSPQYEQTNWGWIDFKGSACSASPLKWSGYMSNWPQGGQNPGDWFILVK